MRVLGDVIISLDTAARQAVERHPLYGPAYSTYDEVRVLLVHGTLHLLGFDHEVGPEAAEVMAQRECQLMAELGWTGKGLVEMEGLEETPPSDGAADDATSRGGAPGA